MQPAWYITTFPTTHTLHSAFITCIPRALKLTIISLLRTSLSRFSSLSLQVSMAADQKDDQRVFQAKQRELLMGVKDLSKHAILADAGDLEDQLERGEIALLLTPRPSTRHILPLHHPLRLQLILILAPYLPPLHSLLHPFQA